MLFVFVVCYDKFSQMLLASRRHLHMRVNNVACMAEIYSTAASTQSSNEKKHKAPVYSSSSFLSTSRGMLLTSFDLNVRSFQQMQTSRRNFSKLAWGKGGQAVVVLTCSAAAAVSFLVHLLNLNCV